MNGKVSFDSHIIRMENMVFSFFKNSSFLMERNDIIILSCLICFEAIHVNGGEKQVRI